MTTCPHCGCHGRAVGGAQPRFEYSCGSVVPVKGSAHHPQACEIIAELRDQLTTCDHENSDLAAKLESMESQNAELRRQVDELGRKWKCVLDNACIEWSEYEPRHWVIDIDCDKSIPLYSIGERHSEAFDAAVTKSMESPNG